MKKLILCVFILILFSPVSFAKPELKDRFDLSGTEEMSLSDYAKICYGENNLEEAMNYILKIKEDDRTAQDWLILGNILQDSGKVADAVFMYNRAINVDKTFYKAYYNLANIYFDENKLNMAVQNYKLASKYNDKFAYANYNLGCVYLEQGLIKKAKTEFIRAIEKSNTVPEFHYNLAYVYKKLGKEKLAKQYLDNYNQLMLSK